MNDPHPSHPPSETPQNTTRSKTAGVSAATGSTRGAPTRTVGVYDRPERTRFLSGGRDSRAVLVIAILIALFIAGYFFL
jgi:hypothetical protein